MIRSGQRRVRSGNWFLAWLGRQPVGIVAGVRATDRPDERHLVALWVVVDQRGTSVATELVEAVCGWARLQGARLVTLWVADGNPRARRFYERLGFRSTGHRQALPSAPEVGEELRQRAVGTLQWQHGQQNRPADQQSHAAPTPRGMVPRQARAPAPCPSYREQRGNQHLRHHGGPRRDATAGAALARRADSNRPPPSPRVRPPSS